MRRASGSRTVGLALLTAVSLVGIVPSASAGPADPSARWVGPYFGLSLGTATGSAKQPGAGGGGAPTGCSIGGTQYTLADTKLFGPGSFLIDMLPLPSSPPDTIKYINVGYYVDAAKLGMVANDGLLTTGLGGALYSLDGLYRTDVVQVQALRYGTTGPIAATDGRSSIYVDGSPIPNPYNCLILLPSSDEYPAGTVAIDYLNGSTVVATSNTSEGVYSYVGGGADVTAHLRGGAASVLSGVNWALGPRVVAGVEARGFATGLKGGGFSVHGLALANGRIGFAGPQTLMFLTAGLAAAGLHTPGGSGTGVGYELGSGLEYALNDRTSLRFDMVFVRLGNKDYGDGKKTRVSFAISSVGVIWRF
jgi:opacity protein-like surface antigen